MAEPDSVKNKCLKKHFAGSFQNYKMKSLILLLTLLCTCKIFDTKLQPKERAGKFLFSVVQFRNNPCGSQSGTRRGTCYTASECNSRSGVASGTCASGFGVCCLFFATSGTVSQNCTYLRNVGFPSPLTDTSQTPEFTIRKCGNDVCAVRLDFETFSTLGPVGTAENGGGLCVDTLTLTSAPNAAVYPIICGQNTGQHVYIEMGIQPSGTASLAFAFNNNGERTFEIKASQIPCSASWRNPVDCFQYFTGTSGRFSTFNFFQSNSNHLANQRYTACIRQEVGYCCVEYIECADPLSFTLNTQGGNPNRGRVDDLCDDGDFAVFNGASNICTNENGAAFQVSKICGSVLTAVVQANGKANSNAVCDCTEPFNIGIVTDAMADVPVGNPPLQSRGICLEWRQLPCST